MTPNAKSCLLVQRQPTVLCLEVVAYHKRCQLVCQQPCDHLGLKGWGENRLSTLLFLP